MTANTAVADGKLTNEELGGFTRRVDEIKRRLNEGALWFPRVMSHLQSIIEGRVVNLDLPALWNVKLGSQETADTYRKALKSAGYRISTWADDILGKAPFTSASRQIEIDLVALSVGELGFKEVAHYFQIRARASDLGFELCPAEVGPALRLAYSDQPDGECLLVAMEAITDCKGNSHLFCVGHDHNDRWLGVSRGLPYDLHSSAVRFVFVHRHK